MSTPYFQDVSPDPAPSALTPADGAPGRPAVPGGGMGPAPYDIAAPQDIAGIAAAAEAAERLAGAGVLYPPGPRQAEAAALLASPQGAGALNVTSGYSPDSDTPNDLSPGAALVTPIQGMGTYPGTRQEGVQQYAGDSGPLEGLAPEGGSMASPGGNYPGTTQDGLRKYGTS